MPQPAAANYKDLVENTRKVFLSGRTLSLEWRRRQLQALIRMCKEQEDAFCQAIYKDLHKHKSEFLGMELFLSISEAVRHLENLDEWTSPQKVKKELAVIMDTCYKYPEPYGTTLVIGAWNYPVQLILLPMIGAIAAGNCVIVKPSEMCEETAALVERVFAQYLDTECIQVVNGGVPETTALLRERFDMIFYTGNSAVGKIVMEAAAKHLTPVILELGGKSPCYVDESSDLEVAARRITWGKFVNCGQTCIAPDYIMMKDELKTKFVEHIKNALAEFYGEDAQQSDLSRIVNSRHFQRVKELLNSGGKIAIGGQMDEKDTYIAPTIVTDVKPTDKLMQEEIFGPVLPIMSVSGSDEAIDFIKSREKPLALYVFAKNDSMVDKFIKLTSSGGVCINDCLMHTALSTLPFGGVGNSGMGSYHGKFSFEAFTHYKACMIKAQAMEFVNKIRYPPYTEGKAKWLQRLMLKKPKRSTGPFGIFLPLIIFGAVLAIAFRFLGLEQYLPKSLTN